MLNLFYRNPRLTVLTICLIMVAGLSSYVVLPRMEDPILTERVALVNTVYPGAESERVESLVTEKLEATLKKIVEIKKTRSISRAGISTITIELRDDVYEVDTVWSRVRDRLADVAADLPPGALEPRFERTEMKAYATLVALRWTPTDETPVSYSILQRLAEELDDSLKSVSGTEDVDMFGASSEEIVVEIDEPQMSALGLNTSQVAAQIQASDSKLSAGQLRGETNLLLEVDGELDSLERIARTPIQSGADSRFVQLADIATIHKGALDPPSSLAIVDGDRAVVLGVLVRPDTRIDKWAIAAEAKVAEFSDSLPPGVTLTAVFNQNDYVATRLTSLLWNLILGAIAVVIVVLVMMGWRSAVIVGSALPLAAMMVLTGMRFLNIPIHQMSVTGLIIAMGLLIDNAIVIVDEVTAKLRSGKSPADAVASSVRHLAVPLLGSTLTTTLAFGPIALMPGPAGEFVSSIAISVILAISSSLFLALTIIPAISAFASRTVSSRAVQSVQAGGLLETGIRSERLTEWYRRSLDKIFRRPVIGIVLGAALPVLGFLQFGKLPEQFFPPADRNQLQIEVEVPSQGSINQTLETTAAIRTQLDKHPEVTSVSWFIGESAPAFYYNIIPRRKNTPSYAQAMVMIDPDVDTLPLIHQLQDELDRQFTESRILVRQLEQGPPFDAPVEVRIFGPDQDQLRTISDQIRRVLSEVPNVVHTRADQSETVPKLLFEIDEEEARMAGVDFTVIAQQLNASLEGSVGGSILESTEELPVRVRLKNSDRAELSSIASLTLQPTSGMGGQPVPISALATQKLVPQTSSIPRFGNRRMNEIQAYIKAGVLPATVLSDFQSRLAESGFELPVGYEMQFGGEAAERDNAVGNLMASVGVLMVLMIATLVLSFGSFRIAGIVGLVAVLSVGLGVGALWVFGYPFGFMAIVGTMGLIGVAINDSIVVLAEIRENESARAGDAAAVRDVVVRASRHVIATSLTTIAGFIPLLAGGGGFWPPLAVTIAGGVGGATILALYFTPSVYILAMRKRVVEPAVGRVTNSMSVGSA